MWVRVGLASRLGEIGDNSHTFRLAMFAVLAVEHMGNLCGLVSRVDKTPGRGGLPVDERFDFRTVDVQMKLEVFFFMEGQRDGTGWIDACHQWVGIVILR